MRSCTSCLVSFLAFASLGVSDSEAQPADIRQAVLLTCDGIPLVVLSSQSSFGAPIVAVGTPCATAISTVVSAPLEEGRGWDVNVTFGDKKVTNYAIVEIDEVPGPQGPAGPKGDTGDPGSSGARVLVLRSGTRQGIDSLPGRIVLAPSSSPPGPYIGRAIVSYDTFGKSGEVRCKLGADPGDPETVVVAPPSQGEFSIGEVTIFPTNPFGGEPQRFRLPVVTCFALVDGDGIASIEAVRATMIPVSESTFFP
jgi:hypothetical protein